MNRSTLGAGLKLSVKPILSSNLAMIKFSKICITRLTSPVRYLVWVDYNRFQCFSFHKLFEILK